MWWKDDAAGVIVDAVIIAFIGFFTWRGWKRGIISTLVRLAGFVAAVVLALVGYDTLAGPMRSIGFSNGIATLSAALLIFAGVTIVAWFGARALTKVVNFTKWGMANRAIGAVLGGAWSLAWAAVILVAISYVPSGSAKDAVAGSTLAKAIQQEAPNIATRAARANLRRLVVSLFG